MFLLIFRYVFGGAISSGGLSYVNFLVPGFVTSSVLFGGMGSAAAVAEDLRRASSTASVTPHPPAAPC